MAFFPIFGGALRAAAKNRKKCFKKTTGLVTALIARRINNVIKNFRLYVKGPQNSYPSKFGLRFLTKGKYIRSPYIFIRKFGRHQNKNPKYPKMKQSTPPQKIMVFLSNSFLNLNIFVACCATPLWRGGFIKLGVLCQRHQFFCLRKT